MTTQVAYPWNVDLTLSLWYSWYLLLTCLCISATSFTCSSMCSTPFLVCQTVSQNVGGKYPDPSNFTQCCCNEVGVYATPSSCVTVHNNKNLYCFCNRPAIKRSEGLSAVRHCTSYLRVQVHCNSFVPLSQIT